MWRNLLPKMQSSISTLQATLPALAQRMMDDIIDLELEKIDTILAKINSDPEPVDLKSVELGLWTKIRENAFKAEELEWALLPKVIC
jgi:hypothetical protein